MATQTTEAGETRRYERLGVSGTAEEWRLIGYRLDSDGSVQLDAFSGWDGGASARALAQAASRGTPTVGAALTILAKEQRERARVAAQEASATALVRVAAAVEACSAQLRALQPLLERVITIWQAKGAR